MHTNTQCLSEIKINEVPIAYKEIILIKTKLFSEILQRDNCFLTSDDLGIFI